MKEIENREFSGEEAYANAYYYFHRVLAVLGENAEMQCDMVGYFNVPWEIKNDALNNGYAVLHSINAQLSAQQKDEIKVLLEKVSNLPDSIINVENSRQANLRAMHDPYWISLRTQAKQLISMLEAETDRVNTILNVRGS